MAQSYASYRFFKILSVIWAPFRWIGRTIVSIVKAIGTWFRYWYPLVIPIAICGILLFAFFRIGPPHRPPAQPEATADSATVRATDQATSDAASAAAPDSSNDRSAAVAQAENADYIFEFMGTGNTGLSILTDRGTGCEYIEERGQPLSPRMVSYQDGTIKQDCTGRHDLGDGDGPDDGEKVDMTVDPNRPGYVPKAPRKH
jgi:hypothetical protein